MLEMLKFMFLVFAVASCRSDAAVTPAATPAPIACGYMPNAIFKCLGNPIITRGSFNDCVQGTECDKMTCIFRKSGWLEGDKVKKAAVVAHFDQFAQEHPEWTKAAQEVKAACLTTELQPQGVFLNCPAYDVMMCSLGVFIGNAQPGQWSTSGECAYPKQYAAACPVCPNDCFAAAIPIGSCNACFRVPKTKN